MKENRPSMIITKLILSIVAISTGIITGFYLGSNYKDIDLNQLFNNFKKDKFQYEYKKDAIFSDKPNIKKLAKECFSEELKCKQNIILDNGKNKINITIITDKSVYNLLTTKIIYNNKTLFEDDYIIISKIALLDNNILVFDYYNQKILVDTTWYHRTFYSLKNKEIKTITIKDEWIPDLETTESITSKKTTYYSYNYKDIDYDNNTVDISKKEISLLEDGTIIDTEIQKFKTRYTGLQFELHDDSNENNIIDENIQYNIENLISAKKECFNNNYNPCTVKYVISDKDTQETIKVSNELLENNIRYITIHYKDNILLKTINTFKDTATIESISILNNNFIVVDYYNNQEYIKNKMNYRLYYSLTNNTYKNIPTYNEELSNIYSSNYDYTKTIANKNITYYELKEIDYENKKAILNKKNLILKDTGSFEDIIIEEIEIEYTKSQS